MRDVRRQITAIQYSTTPLDQFPRYMLVSGLYAGLRESRFTGNIWCWWLVLFIDLAWTRFLMFWLYMWVDCFVHTMDLRNCHTSSTCSSPCCHSEHGHIITSAEIDKGNGNHFINLTAVSRNSTEIVS